MLQQLRVNSFRDFILWLGVMLAGAVTIWLLPEPEFAKGLAHYAPLHTFLEVVAIAIAVMVFGNCWAAQKFNPDGRTLLLSIGFLGVAFFDLSHALAYPGMPDFFTPNEPGKMINFWLMARLLAGLTLVIVAFWPVSLIQRLAYPSRYLVLLSLIVLVMIANYIQVHHQSLMPATYIKGVGLTAFKVNTEYFLILMYVAAGIGFLIRSKHNRKSSDFLLALSSLTMAMSEWFFTVYVNLGDVYNVAGHVYKIIAYGLLYRGVYLITVKQPYDALKQSELQNQATLSALPDLLFEVDRAGVYQSVLTTAHQNKLAAPIDSIVGRHLSEMLPPEAAKTGMEAIAEADQTGFSRGKRIEIDVPDGHLCFELSISKKPRSNNKLPTFLILSRDVTEHVNNEKKILFEARLNASLLDLQERTPLETEAEFLARWAAHAKTLLSSQTALVCSPNAGQDAVQVLLWSDLVNNPANETGSTKPIAMGQLGCWSEVLRSGQPLILNRPLQTDDAGGLPLAALSVNRLVTVPIMENDHVTLLIGLGNKATDFSSEEVKALQVLGATLWNMLKHKRKDAWIDQLSEALEQSPHAVAITDIDAKIIYVNKAFCDVSGYSLQEVIGKNPNVLRSGLTSPKSYQDLWGHLTRGESWQGEFINRRKNGETYIELVSVYPVMNRFGQVTNYVAHKIDMTQQKAAEKRIRDLSDFDALTGLLNKKSFEIKLSAAIQHAEDHHELLSLLWFNLDNFKVVNDSLGHEAGDEILAVLARRLIDHFESRYVVARYSGDTFVVIVPREQQSLVALTASEVLSQLKSPLVVNEHRLSISASVGVAVYPEDARMIGPLLSAAEIAMYRAKQDGRNSLRFFSAELQQHTQRSLDLSASLQGAAERGELYLVYQPQLDCAKNKIVGAEALLRWDHPRWGAVTPGEFIPLAEQTGQIVPIGKWLMEQVASQIHIWDQAGLPKLLIAINVSAVQFVRPGFVEDLNNVMASTGVQTDRIDIEITEAVALNNEEQAIKVIAGLHQAGFRVAIDDFGTGYSSLSYLKRYAINKLKIDQSFVSDLVHDQNDQAIVSAIIKMAQSLGMTTIAEGVETSEQAAYLRELGCDEIQGYWLSRPVRAQEFERLVLESFSLTH